MEYWWLLNRFLIGPWLPDAQPRNCSRGFQMLRAACSNSTAWWGFSDPQEKMNSNPGLFDFSLLVATHSQFLGIWRKKHRFFINQGLSIGG